QSPRLAAGHRAAWSGHAETGAAQVAGVAPAGGVAAAVAVADPEIALAARGADATQAAGRHAGGDGRPGGTAVGKVRGEDSDVHGRDPVGGGRVIWCVGIVQHHDFLSMGRKSWPGITGKSLIWMGE